MLANLVSLLGKTFQTGEVTPVKKTTSQVNPFANPFVNSEASAQREFYGKNKPVHGGYFAGYYNGKPNIVGTRLFIEV
ncbi:MAG: hypothetical protein PHX18_03920 [Candidatus Gastranaerophilales bacterium]|nr:hypothetical protein [Candidatus Gastranaerophilales bacterium]